MRTTLLLAFTLGAGCQVAPDASPSQCDAPPPVVTSATGASHDFIVNSFVVPQMRAGFPYDLNCDGKNDNQLGSIIAALEGAEVGEQSAIDQAIDDGSLALLIRVTADDLDGANQAGATLLEGKVTSGDFGERKVSVDDSIPTTSFFGRIEDHTFRSNPQRTSPPLSLALRIPIPNAMITLPVVGAHLQFVTGTDGATGAPGLLAGQINGGVRPDDFRAAALPAFAAFFTQELKDAPADHVQLQKIFDTGGCDDNGVPAKANDSIIATCELAQNQIINNVISADVQLFDSDGTFDPSKQNGAPDVISIGLGFTAVQASF